MLYVSNKTKGDFDMIVNLGEKIKELRKKKDISQEVLAQYLGVTFQAVSKWENGTTMPDVGMIPAIASFFDVTTDELFNYDLMKTEEKVMEICSEAAKIRNTDPIKAEEILNDALKKYPGNIWILNNLLYPLMIQGKREEDILKIARTIVEMPNADDEARLDAYRIIAETSKDIGEMMSCRNALDKIPELYFNVNELKARLLDGEEKLENASLCQQVMGATLMEMMIIMAEYYEKAGEVDKAKRKSETLIKVIDAFMEDVNPIIGTKLCEIEEIKEYRVRAQIIISKDN